MGGEDSRRRAEAATFAWSTLQKTVREYPVIGVLLAVAVPLLGAAGVFLLPFALPLAIGLFIWTKRGGAKADRRGRRRCDGGIRRIEANSYFRAANHGHDRQGRADEANGSLGGGVRVV